MVTIEKIKQLFAYGELTGLQSMWTTICDFDTFGHHIKWRNKSIYFGEWKSIKEHRNPPHIVWNNDPVFAYIGFVDGALEYRYGYQGESIYSFCPIVTSAEIIGEINAVFDIWFDDIFKIADFSYKHHRRGAIDVPDRLALIRNGLNEESDWKKSRPSRKFYLDEWLLDFEDILLYVAWDGYDDEIVAKAEKILKTGCLDAKITMKACDHYELNINYKGRNRRLSYPNKGSEREITLFALNNMIIDDFEIRFCKDSGGMDTLSFLVLSTEEWRTLEEEYKGAVATHFEALYACTLSFADHHQIYLE